VGWLKDDGNFHQHAATVIITHHREIAAIMPESWSDRAGEYRLKYKVT